MVSMFSICNREKLVEFCERSEASLAEVKRPYFVMRPEPDLRHAISALATPATFEKSYEMDDEHDFSFAIMHPLGIVVYFDFFRFWNTYYCSGAKGKLMAIVLSAEDRNNQEGEIVTKSYKALIDVLEKIHNIFSWESLPSYVYSETPFAPWQWIGDSSFLAGRDIIEMANISQSEILSMSSHPLCHVTTNGSLFCRFSEDTSSVHQQQFFSEYSFTLSKIMEIGLGEGIENLLST